MRPATIVLLLFASLTSGGCGEGARDGSTTACGETPTGGSDTEDVGWVSVCPALEEGCTAEAIIDGLAVGPLPVRAHPLRPGPHMVEVLSPGDCAGAESAEVALLAGEHHVLDLTGAELHHR